MSVDARQIVVFQLASETYGLDIHKVYEIIMMPGITRIPRTPGFVEGVINLRGNIVPIFDLRKRLLLPPKNVDQDTRVIIVEIAHNTAGMIVDGVSEVMTLPEGKLEPPSPLVMNSVEGEYLEGVINLEEQLIIMLNLDNVFTVRERESLRHMSRDITETQVITLPDVSMYSDTAGGLLEPES
jgi:purine-binding chemotaxis protein CheW